MQRSSTAENTTGKIWLRLSQTLRDHCTSLWMPLKGPKPSVFCGKFIACPKSLIVSLHILISRDFAVVNHAHTCGFRFFKYHRQVTSSSEVQVITATAAASDLDGYFVVGLEGHWSEKINHDATAEDMASALAGIPAVGEVEVRNRL